MSAGASRAPNRASKWSNCVREIIPDFLHVLDPNQNFLYVSPSCKTITQYEPAALIGRPVHEFIHPDDHGLFLRELEYSRLFNTQVRFFYRFHTLDTHWAILDCQAQWHAEYEADGALPPPHIAAHQGYLVVSRPYLNETTSLLDSFLEVTIEKERLTRRIKELREEQDDQEAHLVNIKEEDRALINTQQQNNCENHDIPSSPTKGDCGIVVPQLKPTKTPAAKRKARRIGEPRRCSSCDTNVSPEWRNGPQGPKTLCNACGLRWAKRVKADQKAELSAAGSHATGLLS